MEINKNCVKQVKAYLEETLEIEVDEKDVMKLVEYLLKKWYVLAKLRFDTIVYKYLNRFNSFMRVYKFWEISQKIRKNDPWLKIEAIVAYYHEDHDTLADKITDLL